MMNTFTANSGAKMLVESIINPDGGNALTVGGIAYSPEFDAVISDGPVQYATVRNPTDYATPSEPIELRVTFDVGVCPDPAHLRVYRDNVEVPCQWSWPESQWDWSRDGGLHADGSVKRGSLWVLGSLPARGTAKYTIRVESTTAAYAQTVTYGEESANLVYTSSPRLRPRYARNRGYIPSSLRDPGAALAEFNGTGAGLYHRFTGSGVNLFSYTEANVLDPAIERVGTDAPGYGVVFQDIIASFNWVLATGSIRLRHRFRHFGNDLVRHDWMAIQSGETMPSGVYGMSMFHDINASPAPTREWPTDLATISHLYSGGRAVLCGVTAQGTESTALRIQDESTLWDALSPGTGLRLGWTKTTAIPAGSRFIGAGFFRANYTDSTAAAMLSHNPIAARATSADRAAMLHNIKRAARKIAEMWTPNSLKDTTAKTWYGSAAFAMIVLAEDAGIEPPMDTAIQLFDRWRIQQGLPAFTADAIHTRWNNAGSPLGYEFLAPNTICLKILHEKLTEYGYAAKAAKVATYIHALADFAVLAEATSGPGLMNLRGGVGPNLNAAAGAMRMLAESLALEANETRLATLTRIAATFPPSYQCGNKTPYTYQAPAGTTPRQTIATPRAAYHWYNMSVALVAHHAYPCLPSILDVRQFALEYCAGHGLIANDVKWSKQLERRGLPGNYFSAMAALLLAPGYDDGDLRLAVDWIEHCASRASWQPAGQPELLDGHLYPDTVTEYGLWGGSDAGMMHLAVMHAINRGEIQ